jgi:hypothetical protein
MFIHAEGLYALARVRHAELMAEATEERRAREVIPMQRQAYRTNWSTRLGHRLIQWGVRLLRPEPMIGLMPARAMAHPGNGAHHSSRLVRDKTAPQSTKAISERPIARLPLYLLTRVTSEIEIETTQFGSYYLTYYRSSHRVAALERYQNETAAREGHHKWTSKNWLNRSFSAVVMSED